MVTNMICQLLRLWRRKSMLFHLHCQFGDWFDHWYLDIFEGYYLCDPLIVSPLSILYQYCLLVPLH